MNLDDDKLPPPEPESTPPAEPEWKREPLTPAEIAVPAPLTESPESASARPEFVTAAVSYVPEDLRVAWGWTDILLLVLFGVAGIILLTVLLLIGFALFGGNLNHLRNSPAAQNFVSVSVQVVLDLALLGYLAAHIRLRFHLPFWHTIGWRPLETGKTPRAIAYFALVMGGFFLAVAVTLASALSPPKGELPIQQILQDRGTAILFALMAVLIAPLVEETLFRGYLYPVIARSFGIGAGVIVTGMIFGLLHAGQLLGGWWQIALMVTVGIVFTLARALSRTVVASYVLHISYNSLQVIALLIDTHGFRRPPSLH